MKFINSRFKFPAVLLGFLISLPCLGKSSFLPLTGGIEKVIEFRGGNIPKVIWRSTLVDDASLRSKFLSNNIGSGIELLSFISTERKSVSDIGTHQKTNTTPECRKHKCKDGLTDEEWEQGFHMFILCFFIIPAISTALGVIAGALGWIPFIKR